MDPDPLDTLLEKLCTGDNSAAETVFRAYEPCLRALVRRMLPGDLRSQFDSIDVVQSIWADLVQGFRKSGWRFESPGQLRAFLIKATRNRFIDRARKNRTAAQVQSLDTAVEPVQETAADLPVGIAEADELWDRMKQLCPPQHHQILELRRQGYQLAEIAQQTGLHESSVRRILYDLARRLAFKPSDPMDDRVTTSLARPSLTRAYLTGATSQVAAGMAQELAERWRKGDRVAAEELLASHPFERPEDALQVICEEICLRQEHGQPVETAEILRRFPQYGAQVRMLLDCHRLLLEGKPPAFPEVGEHLGEFELWAELGRGAVGRVFLATQPALADRLVVLKVGPRSGHEHLSLARLQHTHIVPLLQVHEDVERNLQVLCMPYFGGVSLDRLLDALQAIAPPRRAGRDFLDALDKEQKQITGQPSGKGPGRVFLGQAAYVDAVCWMGACLADALQHAHDRGLIHLDVKPSNVLIAADGQPMLLDFHLAVAPVRPGGPAPEFFGGTPGYLSPEQHAAMAAIQNGQPIPTTVDGRSDVYSLGVLLFRCLAGRAPAAPIRLNRLNGCVSPGLADIVARCLEPQRQDRYATAGAVAEDLRRHLADLPLKGVRNRSLVERWRKWRRRRPHAPLAAALLLTVVAAAAGAGYLLWDRHSAQVRVAKQALTDGQGLMQRRAYGEAARSFARGQEIARTLPGQAELVRKLTEEANDARRAQLRQELHALADRIRFVFDSDSLAPDALRKVADACQALWQARDKLDTRDEQVRTDLLDLALLSADLRVRAAAAGEVDGGRAALAILAEAEEVFGPSPMLALERQRHSGGDVTAVKIVPQTAWDHYALGRSLLRSGRLADAQRYLDQAVALQPDGFWPNFYQGCCAYRAGKHAEAVNAFRVCISLSPQRAECYFNRALAYEGLGQRGPARQDYDRALKLDPQLGSAWLNRGILHYLEKRPDEALADLRQSLSAGADPALVHYHLALVYHDRREPQQALAHLQQALAARPGYAPALELQKQLKGGR